MISFCEETINSQNPRTTMKKSAKKLLQSAPVVQYLSDPTVFTDNKLDEAFSHLGFGKLLSKVGFRKQKGDHLLQVMFAMLIWPLLEVRSISSFCSKFLSAFISGGFNVLYDFQKHENLNWRKLRQSSAKQVYRLNKIQNEKTKAFVFDDSLKERRGKKVEAVSTHFDHTTNRHIKGQQLLEMGLVSPKGYLLLPRTTNAPWQTFSIPVEINLEERPNKKRKWVKVQLVFVTPKHQQKKAYALFLCTDTTLSDEKTLETYSLRWSIEVYFKEVKQYMGFLKEQTGNYVCHYASIHLSPIRYLLFSHILMTEGGGFFGKLRDRISKSLELLSFAGLLWELFRALIFGTLDQLKSLLGDNVLQTIKEKIDCTITEFLSSALQLDSNS